MAQMNLSMKQKQTHWHRGETCGCQRGEERERGVDWEFGVGRCKLLLIEWINTKILLYSIGTISNLLGYAMMEKNIKKECIYVYMYITESYCMAEFGKTL